MGCSCMKVEGGMEGAGASMVSPAAELATRGMDSADEETEVPSAVQDLIRRLGETNWSDWSTTGSSHPDVTEYSILRRPEVKIFFPEDAPLSKNANTGWRSQVRLRVLEAIGSCISSSELLDVGDICDIHMSRLTASEWEVVLRGFRSSSVLREMRIGELKWSSEADLESLGLQLAIILNTSSVTHLAIGYCRLTARFFLNLASGLRENSHSKLKSIELRRAWCDANAVKFIVEVLNGHHQLETLSLVSPHDVDEAAVELLSQALKQNSSLKELALYGVEGESAALLLNTLAEDDGNRSIERLELISMSGIDIGECLAEVFNSNRSLRVVTLGDIIMPVKIWRLLGEAIRDNATMTTVNLWRYSLPILGLEELARAASSDEKDLMLHLKIQPSDYSDVRSALNLLRSVLRGEIKSIKSFGLYQSTSGGNPYSSTSGGNRKSMEGILSMNGKTGETSALSRLELELQSEDIFKGVWKQLLQCLRGNTSVTSLFLSFSQCDGGFLEEFRDLMALLQVNLTLREIDVSNTPWGKDGKAALIEAALKQNQQRAVYMSVFTEAKLQFGDAKAGRLFLCGSPKAGKTQLRRTLMKIIQDKNWFRETVETLLRTKGIEVEFLQNDDEMQISIWDLAGQWIFRTLQNVLFPHTNDFCVFLFVYSPFCEETSSPKQEFCFRTELEGWLTFIASSTKVTGHNLPQVLVVISHKDKMASTSLTWAESMMEELRKRFANYVDLCPIRDFLYVNAQERNQVIPLKNHIFEMFKKLFCENSPRVPQLCFQLSSRLLSNIKKEKTCPLLSLEKFHEFCSPSLKQLILPSYVDHPRLLTSLISYLNDVGSIIYIPNLDHIIVDPNWLTNSVLGELIAMGQHFQAEESNAYEKSMSSDSYTSKDGFVSESVFARLLETFLGKQSRFQNVDREVLEKILFNLDLGFKLEDSSQYFIPSFISEYASMEEQKQQEGARAVSMSWDSMVATSKFVGIRIQCEDLKTMSLTAAFFPRFQMFMRRKLISEMSVSMETVTFSRHYLRLYLDGHQIYVEHVQSEKSHNYVDVLMLCSEHKSKEAAIKYVMDNIVHELISFCASPNGCPGVALVLGVIQTICVEKLIPTHLRGAILIEELKSKFSNDINKKLRDIALDRSQLVKEEELIHYEYTWPPIPTWHLNATFERATNLLWESDVETVVNEIRQKRSQQLESLQQSLISLNNDLAQSHPQSKITVSNSSLPHMKDYNPASASCSSQASTSVGTQLVLSEIHQLGEKVDSVHETVRSVKSIVEGLDVKMGQIISLQQQLQSTFNDFMSNVDRMIGYSESHQQAKTPKRPYVTDDVGLFYKMSASLHLKETVCLRLMCESITGFHPVEGQEGLMLRLDKENRGWIPKVIDISYKILYYALKAGLDVTLGLGAAIPEWNDLKTDIVRVEGISKVDGRAIRKSVQSKEQSEELNQAWLRIQQTLAPELKNNFSKIFRLYQVKYKNGGHAWVCEKCMTKDRLFIS
ncbi:hypothetical protein MPTK1_6g14600 [Marchantia polymorpha subsp. ruderalis]|uniref:C-terminal of Roc (COR) domain-containing protein n=1 Tax=Marchantia polymorpha subsp. ruderalis TaxID=1480154 RepID=A0AAF6BS15_MARPO|nr:hypothetical protein Mp_6g14600 [Marchantia polymorpha subsp. ruderalis]